MGYSFTLFNVELSYDFQVMPVEPDRLQICYERYQDRISITFIDQYMFPEWLLNMLINLDGITKDTETVVESYVKGLR